MSKALVIPDVHLKPWMFEKADELVSKSGCDYTVLLGDIADDWNQGENLDLYNTTFDTATEFVNNHPNTLWCYGNHDLSYLWQRRQSGYSEVARETVVECVRKLRNALTVGKCKYIHRIDNTLFSHAGLTRRFISREIKKPGDIDRVIDTINGFGMAEMWNDYSPIWARPQYVNMELYPDNMFQVVGHTPVHAPLYEEEPETGATILTLDTFSTYSDGGPIGDQRFVWVDTIEKTWKYV